MPHIEGKATFQFSTARATRAYSAFFKLTARLYDSSHHEDRFNRLIMEGETDVDTIIAETFDEDSW